MRHRPKIVALYVNLGNARRLRRRATKHYGWRLSRGAARETCRVPLGGGVIARRRFWRRVCYRIIGEGVSAHESVSKIKISSSREIKCRKVW